MRLILTISNRVLLTYRRILTWNDLVHRRSRGMTENEYRNQNDWSKFQFLTTRMRSFFRATSSQRSPAHELHQHLYAGEETGWNHNRNNLVVMWKGKNTRNIRKGSKALAQRWCSGAA